MENKDLVQEELNQKVEVNAQTAMELAIAKAKLKRQKLKDQAKLDLINNEHYVDYLASIEDEKTQISKLQAIMDKLNGMKAIVANDGTNYKVNIYPVAEYAFGPVMSRVLGIITGSSAMFTDDRQDEFEAITNTSYLAVSNARNALGSPAYYSKGVFTPAIEFGQEDAIQTAVVAVCDSLNIDINYISRINTATLSRWFNTAEAKAKKQFAAYQKVELVDSENNFTIED